MNHLLRFVVIAALAACFIVFFAIGMARHDADLLAPVNLLLFLVGLALYLLPTGLAVYRDCVSSLWIAVVNVLLGWTVIGWALALGWAASGHVHEAAHPMSTPPTHPVPGH